MNSASRGFTLLELLIVICIAALGSAAVVVVLRNEPAARLEREAARLAALLDAARAMARVSGAPIVWRAMPGGFAFEGANGQNLPKLWLDPQIQVGGGSSLQLGPEPIIGPQRVLLQLTGHPHPGVSVASDGIGSFKVITWQNAGER